MSHRQRNKTVKDLKHFYWQTFTGSSASAWRNIRSETNRQENTSVTVLNLNTSKINYSEEALRNSKEQTLVMNETISHRLLVQEKLHFVAFYLREKSSAAFLEMVDLLLSEHHKKP